MTAVQVRPYQAEALAAIDTALDAGVRRQLLVMATGGGKTIVFGHLIANRPGRALVLAHRDELINQAVDKLHLVDPWANLGIVKAARDERFARVVVASVQTLIQPKRLAQLGRDFDTVIVDEAHHAVAPTYKRVLEQAGAFDEDGPLVLGVTATAERGDNVGLGDVFQKIVFEKGILPLIREGYLADIRATQVKLRTNLDAVHTRGGDFADGELGEALMGAAAPEHAAEAWLEHAADRKGIIFTPTVALARAMARTFKGAGIAAEWLSGETPLEERRGILARLHSGQTRVVANCAVLTEGFDEPSVDCIVIARPTTSRALYQQMVGRGTRIYPGKQDLLILDLVGTTSRHQLVTAASLFGLPPATLRDGKATVTQALDAQEQAQHAEVKRGVLIAEAVNVLQRLAWVQTAQGFIVSLGADQALRLAPVEDGSWTVMHQEAGQQQVLATGLDLGYAQGVAEDFARQQGPAARVLVDPQAGWRQQPATDKQLAWLRWRGIAIPAGLTRGEASNLITRANERQLVRA